MFSFPDLPATFGISPAMAATYLAGFAAMAALFGGYALIVGRSPAAGRLRRMSADPAIRLLKTQEGSPRGLLKSLVPDDPAERAQIRFQLGQVGFDGEHAVRDFFVLRLALALSVPLGVLLAVALANLGALPGQTQDAVLTASRLRLLQIAAVGGAAGFYGPGYWLKGRIESRKSRLRAAFPNALDLLQISVESGLGLDAAVTRVGAEIGRIAPEIAFEFLLLQHELQAGREREAAMYDMADRIGLPEARSFVTVVLQSMQFGTSMTQALANYAVEMRQMRELAAQEKANKLPVQMSAVMSFLMLPALFLITLTPIVIRYMAIF